jgi:hypothetical protein
MPTLPLWRHPIRRRQHPALRQFRNVFLFVRKRHRLATPRNIARRTGDRIGKNGADLRSRRHSQRKGRGGQHGRETGQDNVSMHLARLYQANRGSGQSKKRSIPSAALDWTIR